MRDSKVILCIIKKASALFSIGRFAAGSGEARMLVGVIQSLIGIENEYLEKIAAALRRRVVAPYDYHDTLLQICYSTYQTSHAIALLVENGMLWDCETLLRTVTEATLKLVFLCIGDDSERNQKYVEYTQVLPELNALKRHERILGFLSVVTEDPRDEFRPLRDLLLAPEAITTLRKKYNGSYRSEVAKRWSFTGLAVAVGRDTVFEPMAHLTVGYGIDSHIVHADSDGVAIRWERGLREEERRESIQEAHASRLVADVLVLLGIQLSALVRIAAVDRNTVESYRTETNTLFDQLKEAGATWREIEYGHTAPQG
jgi:Family of unknown function (DUF5677)